METEPGEPALLVSQTPLAFSSREASPRDGFDTRWWFRYVDGPAGTNRSTSPASDRIYASSY